MAMKKYSLQQTTNYNSNLNGGTANNRTTKVDPKAGQSAVKDDSYIKADPGTGLGSGTGASRYASTKPGYDNQFIGDNIPLVTNSPAHNTQNLIGPGTYNKSTPVRRKGK